MIWFRLFYVELLKTKRSLALLMMFACPLMIVALYTLMMLDRGSFPEVWSMYWIGVYSIWAYLMAPLYIALVAALLNATDHKNGGWRLMLSMPIKQWQLFVVKSVLAWVFFVGSVCALYGLGAIGVLILQTTGIEGDPGTAFNFGFFDSGWKLTVACLPVLVIQHIVSWRFTSFVTPLALAVIMTVVNSKAMSSSYWVYDPWSYMIMIRLGSDADNQLLALKLSVIVGIAIFTLGAVYLGRREVSA